ncbi:MAG: cytochrome b/b6 domain-containing protein [Hyphomonadaceae bacterium]
MSAQAQRYTAVAIVLHWAIAFAILLLIPLGFWMHEAAEHGAVSDNVFRAYQLHKSIGLTVLALSIARLAWRLINPPPPMPAHMPGWERFVAKATHWAFYALMLALPLSGWLYVSAGWSIHDEQPLVVTTRYFDLFRVPALFGLPQASEGVRAAAAEAAFTAHWVLAYAMIALAALHVLAALKHHLFDRDEVLAHMIPGLRAPHASEPPPKNPLRLAILGGGLALVGVALAAALFAVANVVTPSGSPPPATTAETTETPATTTVTPPALAPTAAPAWRVDPRASSIGFAFTVRDEESGEDSRFEGRFTRWSADIRFDPDNLAQSAAAVSIDASSATDGVPVHDNWMPQAPWFDVASHATATFRTTEIRRAGDAYEARGRLTIRGRSRDVRLPFTLAISGDSATMRGQVTLDRRDFDLGKDTEADDLVSRDVVVTVRIEAVRAP